MIKILTTLLTWLFFGILVAQPNGAVVYDLDTVVFSLPLKPKLRSWSVDLSGDSSLFLGLHLGEVLVREAPIFVRSYGPVGLASLSIRGGTAAQTRLFWEGLPLGSLSLGQGDLSLFGAGNLGSLRLDLGLAGDGSGNNSLGGSLHLGARVLPDSGRFVEWSGHLGSWNRHRQHLVWREAAGVWAWGLECWRESGDNDYGYRWQGLRGQSPWAGQWQWGLQAQGRYRAGGQDLRLLLWLQEQSRLLSPTLLERGPLAWQGDGAFRALLLWRNAWGKWTWGRNVERMAYRGSGIESDNLSRLDFVQWLWARERGAWAYDFLLEHQFLGVKVGAYANPEQRQVRNAGAGALRYGTAFWGEFSAQMRWERYDAQLLWPALAGRWAKVWAGRWELGLSVGRQYRLPSFNDWYWQPGGRLDLRAENNLGGDLVLDYLAGGAYGRHGLSLYYYGVRDWIQWLPSAGGIWEARNLSRVVSRGLEYEAAWDWGRWSWGGRYALSLASGGAGALFATDKQLIYSPVHQGMIYLRGGGGGLTWTYTHSWTGVRFITEDHSAYLPWHQTGHLDLAWLGPWGGGIRHYFFLHLDNVWNEAYAVMALRPMPSRHWRLGWRVEWSNLAKT